MPIAALLAFTVGLGPVAAPTPDPGCAWRATAVALARSATAAAVDGTDARAVAIRDLLQRVGITATAAPTCTGRGTARSPGQLLDLDDWYLTLPTGAQGDPDVVNQPELAAYTDRWFHLDDAGDGVAFTADVGGATTGGSSYPRSELREMAGTEHASWSNTTGTHTLSVRQAVTALPSAKPHVVTAQIHDAQSDVLEVRLEGERLLAEYADGSKDVTIDPAYVLGTPYDLTITATDGHVQVTYDGKQVFDEPIAGSGWYFKTGSYVQSNPDKGDSADAVATVVLYSLKLTHAA